MKNKKKKRARKIMEAKPDIGAENLENQIENELPEGTDEAENIEIVDGSEPAGETKQKHSKQEETEAPTQEEWAEALKKTVEERDGYKDSYLRAQAEFQNFKRRNAATRAEAYEDGVRETISAVLPAIDNLELAVRHAEAGGENDSLTQGVKMTLKLLTEALGKMGLEEVPALGQTFDPEKHNAVMREPGGEENVISEVFQKGYKVHDRMIRYAMVKVYSGADA